MTIFDLPAVKALVESALAEDIGRGDLTTLLTVGENVRARATIVAKQSGVIAGLPLVRNVFRVVSGDAVDVTALVADGDSVRVGTVVASLVGPARDLLAGERLSLNMLQHLSGVATLTRRYVEAIAGTKARIIDTRKTTPGLRVLEKYAVRVGGGWNHRSGLDDGVLIKDNHIVAAGGIRKAVERARSAAPHTVRIEVECTDLAEVDEALAAKADAILLDNMTVETMAKAVRRVNGRALLEASGGVTLETVRAVAETGVDLVSVGALTHSAPALDLSMKVELVSSAKRSEKGLSADGRRWPQIKKKN
jgi:nicotinate-nucleotide pyrophosphorylase (carboxylating)